MRAELLALLTLAEEKLRAARLLIILHKCNSPAWLKHIQKATAALGGLAPEKMAPLRPGEAYIWSSKATDEAFTVGTVKIRLRPRVTQHGGGTKTAV